MRKGLMVLLSVLLVLSIGQTAFAKGKVSLLLGYEGYIEEENKGNPLVYQNNGLKIDLSGNYYFTEKFSISGGVNATMFFYEGYDFTMITANLSANYDVFIWNRGALGVSLGIIDSFKSSNYLFIAPGLNAQILVSPKIGIYTKLSFPINCNEDFFKAFFYDIKLGGTYEITPKIDLGIEANISNSTALGSYATSGYADFTWGIGVKVGYSF